MVGLVVVLASSCGIFGANLPPGTAGGNFIQQPKGLPRLSGSMRQRRDALDEAAQQRVRRHFELLQELIHSSAALREQMERSQRRLQVSFLDDKRVSALDRELVLEGAHWFIELDLLLYSLWTSYRQYLPYASEPDPYAPSRGATLLSRGTRTKGGLVALVAEIVRLDNARVVIGLMEGQWAITQFLNRGDPERGIEPESFDRMVGAYRDPDRRVLLKSQLESLQARRKELDALAASDGQIAYLLALLDESVVARELLDEGSIGRQLRFSAAVVARSGVALLTPFLNLYIAAVISDDTIDPSSLRRLAAVPGVADDMLDTLEPLDVLMLRDATRSSASVGYTHAVIYLGSYVNLKDSPANEHIAFVVNRAQLRRGRVFLDISARGAELVDLDEVLEAQDVAVLRYGLREGQRRMAMQRVFDALVARQFVTPPQLSQREHAARLLSFVYAESLAAEQAPGRHAPPLSIIIRDALNNPGVDVVYSTLDGNALAPEVRARAVTTILQRQGPVDEPVSDGAD
jgi:hypothetical protein